ncbi:MAG: hypothetical protein ACSHX8_07240 [Opitutaceae bacterium]
MHQKGYPSLFFGQSRIFFSFDSWPVCPKRISYRQYDNFRGNRTWGTFIIDARHFGESLIRYYPNNDHTHIQDRRFVEWLMDADQHTDETLKLPDSWWSLGSSIDNYVRNNRVDAFCAQCNQRYPYKQLVSNDDPGNLAGSNFNRLFCPRAHLLLKIQTIHICRSPGKFNLKEAMERYDRLTALPGLFDEYR